MNRKIITGIIILLFAAMPALAGTVQLPKTGQTISYATGDDGDLEMGVAWPDTRFSDSGNTVKDNLTGLVWTKNANLPGGTLTWEAARDYVAGMNAGTHPNFGYTDWRLPNVNELKSLTDNSRYNPALPQGHPFTNVQSDGYWSSTTHAYYTDYVWLFIMNYGCVSYASRSYCPYYYAWPVRSGQCGSFGDSVICLPKTGQTISYAAGDDGDLEMGVAWPDTRFTDKVDGTVKDNLTGLVWTKNANLPNGTLTWQAALDYVAGMNAGTNPNFGYTDWRLPNVNELKSLIDNSKYNLALPQGHPFINVQSSSYYWSSTALASNTDFAWVVSMVSDDVDGGSRSDDSPYSYAWPVRAGQGGGSFGALVISKSSNGTGIVTSDPAGINCGSDCSESYDIGTQVTLYAAADTGSVFTGWSGAGCSGTGDCIVSIDGSMSVTAEFQVQTLITLSSFTSAAKAGQIILTWVTESEIDNAGFNIYRATSENGEYIKINDSLITAKGSPVQDAAYEFVDKGVKNGRTYYYKLEDIDLSGKSTLHGPVGATPRLIFGMGK